MHTAHDGVVYRRENRDVPSVDRTLPTMCLNIDCGYLLILYDIDVAGQYHKPLGRSGSTVKFRKRNCYVELNASEFAALIEVTSSIPV